jgi:hypothetical protein
MVLEALPVELALADRRKVGPKGRRGEGRKERRGRFVTPNSTCLPRRDLTIRLSAQGPESPNWPRLEMAGVHFLEDLVGGDEERDWEREQRRDAETSFQRDNAPEAYRRAAENRRLLAAASAALGPQAPQRPGFLGFFSRVARLSPAEASAEEDATRTLAKSPR